MLKEKISASFPNPAYYAICLLCKVNTTPKNFTARLATQHIQSLYCCKLWKVFSILTYKTNTCILSFSLQRPHLQFSNSLILNQSRVQMYYLQPIMQWSTEIYKQAFLTTDQYWIACFWSSFCCS